MPIYDYKCSECENKFESFENIKDKEDKQECPYCSGESFRVSHFKNQNLKRPDYIPPPKATRKFGEKKITPHVRKKWE